MTATLDVIDSYLALDSTQYAQVPIGATRVATKGNGTNLYGTIPTWTVTGPYEIEFDVVFPTTTVGSIKVFFDSADANNRTFLYLSATGAMRFSGAITMYVDGVATADNAVNHPLDGAVHHIKLVNTGTVNLTNIYRKYDDTYYNTCAMFNLRLTDVNNPANSRFYPLDNSYGHTLAGNPLESTDVLTSHFNDTDFYYWQAVSGSATIDGVALGSSSGRFYVNSVITCDSGAALRLNFEAGVIKIGYHFVIKLEVLAGDCTSYYADVCDSLGGTATQSGNIITIKGTRTSDKASDATYKFVDFVPSGGTTITFKILSITQTPALTWYNRTSGDVVTVYPDAIKPGEEFYLAIKYKVTDVSKNSGYNNPFSIGRRASGAYSCISLYLPESNGKFYVDPYNGLSRTTGSGIPGRTMGVTHLDGLTHVAVVRLKADGSYEFWIDADTPKYTGVPNSQLAYAMDVINLNGYANATTGAAARMGINFHYVYLYSALSGADITALMQGATPETVGTIRQGYDLNGNGNEKNGGNPLVLYGNPSFTVSGSSRKSKHNTVESIVCGIAYGV